jgi:hypothetical protein
MWSCVKSGALLVVDEVWSVVDVVDGGDVQYASRLQDGIAASAAAFARGFEYFAPAGAAGEAPPCRCVVGDTHSPAFPRSAAALALFTPKEVSALLSGGDSVHNDAAWQPEAIAPHINIGHGYNKGSPQVSGAVPM